MSAEVSIPKVAIHLIAEHATIETVKVIEEPERFIELLVKMFNAGREKEGKKSHEFHPVSNLNWNRNVHEGIYLKAYYSRRPHMNKAAEALDALTTTGYEYEFQSISLHFAYFCYFAVKSSKKQVEETGTKKVWAVFALTTYDAFRLTRPYCDYNFPTKIAFRILVPEVGKEHYKPLVGPKEGSSTVYKKPSGLKTQEHQALWILYTDYDAQLKPNCSLRPYLPIKSDSPLGIHIGEGMIRFGMSLTLSQYVLTLPHLLEIRQGKPTECEDGKPELDDPDFQVFANIQRVHGELKGSLEDHLLRFLWEATTNERALPPFYLSHWHYRGYFDSTEFTLNCSSKEGELEMTWFYPPTFRQLVECLQIRLNGSSLEDFRFAVGNATFHCNGMSGKKGLMEFIQGEIVYSGDVYFRLRGAWLKVLSQHLAATERTFLEVVKECLITEKNKKGHLLPHQWISKQEWVAFSEKDKPETVRDETYSQAMKKLKDRSFSVIHSDGTVSLGYPIREMLKDETLKTIKAVKKKWEELSQWLEAHQGEKVEASDLKEIFPTIHEKVLGLLQKQFPVCQCLQMKKSSFAPVGEKGKVQVSSLDHYEMPNGTKKTVLNFKAGISELLSRNETLKEDDLSGLIKNSRWRKGAYKWLTSKHMLSQDFSSRYLALGPIPPGTVKDDIFCKFFQEKHEAYKQVMDEENYNRLYLNRENYLVFDQVFPGERDEVELFDLLYYGEKGKLYLYAIKEGFGTSTGIACTQIRVAAENLLAAKKSNSDQLSNLYDRGVKTKGASDFRKKLAEDLHNMGKEEFVKLFKERELVFVYAFLDTNSKDHRLEDQLKLPQKVTLKELESIEQKRSGQRDLLTQLKEKGYLDKDSRLADKFLRESAKDFEEEMGSKGGGLRKLLMRRVSRFVSMIAKLELIKLHEDLKQMGFKFRIQQLSRPGERADTFAYLEVDSLSPGESLNSIEVKGQVYTFSSTPYSIEELLQKFFGQEDSYSSKLLLYIENRDEGYLELDYELAEKDLQSAFQYQGCELVIIDEDDSGEPEIPEECTIVIKSGDHYYLTKEKPMVLKQVEKRVGEALDSLGAPDIKEAKGLGNSENDCFLNAILQAFIHSGFYETLLNNVNQEHPFCPLFRSFLHQYKRARSSVPTKYMRGSLPDISRGQQEDAAEVLEKIFDVFNLQDEAAKIRIKKEVKGGVSHAAGKDPAGYSQLDVFRQGEVQPMPIIPLTINEDTDSFKDCWELTSSTQNGEFYYVDEGKVYKGGQYKQSYSLENSPEFLFIQFKRYKFAGGKTEKIDKELEIDKHVEVDGRAYGVHAAINHHGDFPTSGHYTCVARSDGVWKQFDDEKIEEIDSYEKARNWINTSYILVLKKREEG